MRQGLPGLWTAVASAHLCIASVLVQFPESVLFRQVLTIVDVSLQSAAPCIRIFAAVMALARSFQGYASFARLVGDSSQETQDIMKEYDVIEVSISQPHVCTHPIQLHLCCIGTTHRIVA